MNSKVFSVVHKEATKDASAIYRSKYSKAELTEFLYDDVKTMHDAFQRGLRLFPENHCYGYRQDNDDHKFGNYKWYSYKEIWERMLNFGSGIKGMNLTTFDSELEYFGIFSQNSVEWMVCDLALCTYSITCLPIETMLGLSSIQYIFESSHVKGILCSSKELEIIEKLDCNRIQLKYIVIMDELKDNEMKAKLEANYKIYSMKEIEEYGKIHRLSPIPPNPTDILAICYTSGSTGEPKGAMIPHKAFISNIAAWNEVGITFSDKDVYLSYLPLSHIMELLIHPTILQEGGCIGFYHGNTDEIFDDLKVLKPTMFVAVPRLLLHLYNKVYIEVLKFNTESEVVRHVKEKSSKFDENVYKHPQDNNIFRNLKNEMGFERLRWVETGGAPLDLEITNFLRSFLCCPLLEGYGQTETMCVSFTSPNCPCIGHLGGPLPSYEIKLIDVPELNYYVTDKKHNVKNSTIDCVSRGEICVRGNGLCCGYFQDSDDLFYTKCLDSDGWFHTGDIAIILPNLAFKIVDRKKNIFKLSQGEFVFVEAVESEYQKIKEIETIVFYGEPSWIYLVCLVVPRKENVIEWGRINLHNCCDYKGIVASAEYQCYITKLIQDYGKNNPNIRGFEVPKGVIVESEAFTCDNGLLTPSGKINRNKINKKYLNVYHRLHNDFLETIKS